MKALLDIVKLLDNKYHLVARYHGQDDDFLTIFYAKGFTTASDAIKFKQLTVNNSFSFHTLSGTPGWVPATKSVLKRIQSQLPNTIDGMPYAQYVEERRRIAKGDGVVYVREYVRRPLGVVKLEIEKARHAREQAWLRKFRSK